MKTLNLYTLNPFMLEYQRLGKQLKKAGMTDEAFECILIETNHEFNGFGVRREYFTFYVVDENDENLIEIGKGSPLFNSSHSETCDFVFKWLRDYFKNNPNPYLWK